MIAALLGANFKAVDNDALPAIEASQRGSLQSQLIPFFDVFNSQRFAQALVDSVVKCAQPQREFITTARPHGVFREVGPEVFGASLAGVESRSAREELFCRPLLLSVGKFRVMSGGRMEK